MLSSARNERLARARASLEGLSVGDALGGFFEGAIRLPLIPDGEVASRVRLASDLSPAQPIEAAVAALGNGRKVSTQDSVPLALWCAAGCLDNYEAAFWLIASGLGDVDSNCAIVGGIVASYTGVEGIPAAWLAAREPLPRWPFEAA